MDNNNPQPPVTNTPGPIPPVLPAAPEISQGSNKMILWFVVGLVVIIAAVAGIYLFLGRQQTPSPEPNPQAVKTQTPVPAPEENLEADLGAIDVEVGADSDFTSIDQDLQQL